MTSEKLKALAQAVWSEIDCAQNDLVWRDHPQTIESLTNAKELLEVIMDDCREEIEELNFDSY